MIEMIGGEHWRGHIVPVYIDNSAFQQSERKGWSKADRLNDLLKRVFQFSVQFGCVRYVACGLVCATCLAEPQL